MLEQLRQVSWKESLLTLLMFLGAISPGFLLLYMYKPTLVETLDSLKLLMFSLGFTAPVILTNIVCASSFLDEKDDKLTYGAVALYTTFVVFYTAILVAYFIGLQFRQFLVVLLLVEVIISVGFYCHFRADRQFKKSREKDNSEAAESKEVV